MDRKFVVLKLFIEELGIPFDIDQVDGRLIVQKAIYLGQLSGIDLGYRYGWYIHGPYCSDLTKDYYALDRCLKAGANDAANSKFTDDVNSLIAPIKNVLQPAPGVQLKDWLELLASYHFLRSVRGMSDEDAKKTIQQQKSHLALCLDIGVKALQESGLVSA